MPQAYANMFSEAATPYKQDIYIEIYDGFDGQNYFVLP